MLRPKDGLLRWKSKLCLLFLFPLLVGPLSAIEPINSPWDRYYELLALQGIGERPYLTIRQMARNTWSAPGQGVEHPWKELSPTNPTIVETEDFKLLAHGVELRTSFNSAYPTSGNDGPIWQGKGANGSISGGVTGIYTVDGHGFQATLLPRFWVAQNEPFELVDPADIDKPRLYGDREYGYFYSGIDFPQRFGDDPLYELEVGESEFRYNYGSFTAGFGTQEMWLGPGRQNAIILSNNGGGVPKVDLGLRPVETSIGSFEGVTWFGRLETSDFFGDAGYDDPYTYYSGISLAYAPSLLPGLTIGVNRVLLSGWNDLDPGTLVSHLDPVFLDSAYGDDERNQLASFTIDWFVPSIGLNAYVEWAREDFSSRFRQVLRAPEHSAGYTLGARQLIRTGSPRHFLLLSAEHTQLAKSRDYEIDYLGGGPGGGYYTHGKIRPGYTHQGQLLGAWIGPGGDSQYVGLDLYYPRGSVGLFVRRYARNKDIIYMRGNIDVDGESRFLGGAAGDIDRLDVELAGGLTSYVQFGPLGLETELVVANTINRNYVESNDVFNVYGLLSVNYRF